MPKHVILGCDRSAGEALRTLEQSGYSLPAEVEFRSLPCGGTLDIIHILQALERGADSVLVVSCFADACRSYNGNTWAEKRSGFVKALLQQAGIKPERVLYRQLSPNMAHDLMTLIDSLGEQNTADLVG